MTHHVLEKLFGSSARVKIMKLFLFNPEVCFEKIEVVSKTKASQANVNRELKLLSDISLVKKRSKGYILNQEFGFLKQLKNLLINNEPLQQGDIAKRIGKTGKIKLIIVSGVFIQSDDSRIDLLVVGDEIKERALKSVVQTMESEIGKELKFTSLKTEDFKYRHSICDRLIRDVLDYPHDIIVDKIGLA